MTRNQQAQRDARDLFRLCCVNGILDAALAIRVAQQVAASRNRNRFHVLARFERLVKLECARRAATVASSQPLPPAVRADIEARLARTYGPGLTMEFMESPALIAGMRIQVGSDVYDGTIQGRLAALEESFG